MSYHVDDEVAHANDDGADDGRDPVDFILGGPAVDEEAYRKHDGADHERREAILGLHAFRGAALCLCGEGLLRCFSLDVPVAGEGEEGDANHAAEADAEKGEPRVARLEVVDFHEEGREAGEEEVEVGVYDADVDAADDANGGEDEHLEGAEDAALEVRRVRKARVELGAQQRVVCAAAQAVCFAAEQDGGVRLAGAEGVEQGEGARQDGHDVEDPAPAEGGGDEAADDGADDGAEEGPDGEAGHGGAAAVLADHVGDGAAAVGDGAGAEDAAEEAEDDEGCHGGGLCAGDDEDWGGV